MTLVIWRLFIFCMFCALTNPPTLVLPTMEFQEKTSTFLHLYVIFIFRGNFLTIWHFENLLFQKLKTNKQIFVLVEYYDNSSSELRIKECP